MDAAKSIPSISDPTTKMLEEEVRELVRDNQRAKAAKPTRETCDDALTAGVTSIGDIERLMEELQIARDFLKSEGERVRLMNARYGHMAKSASASVKIISESLGKWRSLEAVDQAPAMMPRAPTLAPVHDGEFQHEADDQ
jgi:hypothetical protein